MESTKAGVTLPDVSVSQIIDDFRAVYAAELKQSPYPQTKVIETDNSMQSEHENGRLKELCGVLGTFKLSDGQQGRLIVIVDVMQ